jgi:ABC-type multidrug transport system fused ATPase/permease subunit
MAQSPEGRPGRSSREVTLTGKVRVTQEETAETRSTLYGLLLKPWKTKVAAVASMLTGLPPVLLYLIIPRIINALARAYVNPDYDPMPKVFSGALYLAGIAVACGILKYIATLLWVTAGSEMAVSLRKQLFEAMMRSEVEYFDQNPIGGILTLLSEDARNVQDAFGPIKGTQCQVIGSLIAGVIAHFVYSWRTALIYTGVFILDNFISVRMMKNMGAHIGKKFFFQAQAMTIAEETIASFRTVRSFNRETEEVKRYARMVWASDNEDMTVNRILNTTKTSSSVLAWTALLCNLYYAGYLASQPDSGYEVGDMMAVFGLQLGCVFSMISIHVSMRTENNAISAGTRILHLTKHQPTIPFDGGDQIENFRGEIEFRNVSFKYPSRDVYVLKNVSFSVKQGETAALVGHSGSGKSTCVQLLERFYDATEGLVLLDGRDIRTLDPRWIHQQIGLVSQDPVLFHATVRTNIIYGTWNGTGESGDKGLTPNGYPWKSERSWRLARCGRFRVKGDWCVANGNPLRNLGRNLFPPRRFSYHTRFSRFNGTARQPSPEMGTWRALPRSRP